MQRNKILCFFATIMIAAVTIYAVFRGGGVSFGQLAESIRDASVPGIALSCISMFGFIFFEGEALREIVFHMGYPTKHKDAFVYSAADIYFSAITPSASGGQPASAFFMIKDGMPATTVMVVSKSDHVYVSGDFHWCVCNSGISKDIFEFQRSM